MPDLKLIALDAEDLAVISAHLQDAVMKVGDLAFLPREKRFAAVANRLRAIGGAKLPVPKGVDPMRARPDRKALKGK